MKTIDEMTDELKVERAFEHSVVEIGRLQEKIQQVTLLLSRFIKIVAKAKVSENDPEFANDIASALMDAEKLMPKLNIEIRKPLYPHIDNGDDLDAPQNT